jgi:hypothetical protein
MPIGSFFGSTRSVPTVSPWGFFLRYLTTKQIGPAPPALLVVVEESQEGGRWEEGEKHTHTTGQSPTSSQGVEFSWLQTFGGLRVTRSTVVVRLCVVSAGDTTVASRLFVCCLCATTTHHASVLRRNNNAGRLFFSSSPLALTR